MRRFLLPVTLLAIGLACKSDNTVVGFDDTGSVDTADTDVVVPGEPVANAGPDQAVAPLSTVVLDGSASYDPGGAEPLVYKWVLKSKPPGSTAALNVDSLQQPSFVADLAGEYEAELNVQNTNGAWDSTPDRVKITARPTVGFYVQLTWSTDQTDLDLHLMDNGAAMWDPDRDCHFCNRRPDWGLSGALDDPSLDNDEMFGFGPETITIPSPADGSYRVAVHYYGEGVFGEECASTPCPPTVATVNLYVNGALTQTWSKTMSGRGQVWNVADIQWPSGTPSVLDTLSQSDQVGCL